MAVLPLKPRYIYVRLYYLEAEFAILDIVGVSAVLEFRYYSVTAYRYGYRCAAARCSVLVIGERYRVQRQAACALYRYFRRVALGSVRQCLSVYIHLELDGISVNAYRKVRSVVVKRIITCMLALEYRYDKISVLLVDVGVDVLYRHLVALAAVLIVVVLICNHTIHVNAAYALQYGQVVRSRILAVVSLPRACYRRLVYAPRLAPLEVTYVAVSISRYRRIVVDRIRHLKADRSSIAAYRNIAVARICGGQSRGQGAR